MQHFKITLTGQSTTAFINSADESGHNTYRYPVIHVAFELYMVLSLSKFEAFSVLGAGTTDIFSQMFSCIKVSLLQLMLVTKVQA